MLVDRIAIFRNQALAAVDWVNWVVLRRRATGRRSWARNKGVWSLLAADSEILVIAASRISSTLAARVWRSPDGAHYEPKARSQLVS